MKNVKAQILYDSCCLHSRSLVDGFFFGLCGRFLKEKNIRKCILLLNNLSQSRTQLFFFLLLTSVNSSILSVALRNKRIQCKHMLLFVFIFYLHVHYPKCNLWFYRKVKLCIILNWIIALSITNFFNKCIHFFQFLLPLISRF